MWKKLRWALALAAIPAVMGYLGCGVENPQPPALAGPSELAISLDMKAVPDQLTADGWSSAVIEATWRDENGQRVSGRLVRFDITTPTTGSFLDMGNLAPLNARRPTYGGDEARSVSQTTDSDGVARVRYWAPFRTDQVNDTVVTITGRPGNQNDYRAAVNRVVDIFLRAADRPIFPGSDECGISVEPQKSAYQVGEIVNFTATQAVGASGQPIARYEWDFGDNRSDVGRAVSHAYSVADTYTVTLWTTESITGSISVCTDIIPVF
jgi:hypothetical protein